MATPTNLMLKEQTGTRLGLTFVFTAIGALGLTLIALGGVVLLNRAQQHAIAVAAEQNVLRAEKVTNAVSNEKANPSTIGVYLNQQFAGAIIENGTFAAAEDVPPGGPVILLFMNPTETTFPTSVVFPPQRITLTTDNGQLTVCVPSIHGGEQLWVTKLGATYFDDSLTKLARAC